MRKVRLGCALVLAVFMLFGSVFSSTDLNTAATAAASYLYETTKNPTVSSIGGEWAVMSLARSGAGNREDFFEKYLENVKNVLKKDGGVLSERKNTEYSRVILSLTAIGENPENICGYNLLAPLADYDKTVWQGISGPIWALIALDCGGYELPKNTNAKTPASRSLYINKILSSQQKSGGWSLSDLGGDSVDITAMAVCALSGYRSDFKVSSAVERALAFLSAAQGGSGAFSENGSECSESTAQVIIALCAAGVGANDERFVKNGNTAFDGLMSFWCESGGFSHLIGGNANRMSSEQGMCALSALWRFENGKTDLYDMSDVESRNPSNGEKKDGGVTGEAEENTDFGESFSDISEHSARQQIEELFRRGIISGKGGGIFAPDDSVSRAEFAAIIARALKIEERNEKLFSDVCEGDWFFGYVAAVQRCGIITGVSSENFEPCGGITKEAAAVMLARAAKLWGKETVYSESTVRDILSGFVDYIDASLWAREALAFCCENGIISNEDIELFPQKTLTRAQTAVMVYNMLSTLGLL